VLLRSLLESLLRQAGIGVHSIEVRVKTVESAASKLERGGDKYSGVSDLTDLLGLRIITYFPDEVDAVALAVLPHFNRDDANSVDKRALLDPDRFGYLSLHYVATLNANRTRLAEYASLNGVWFELQIRSILQHAWAEIEHDLGYKGEVELPLEMRRRFSRLAGLLELADDEFRRLRRDREQYDEHVQETLTTRPEALELNRSTVRAWLEEGRLARELDQRVATGLRLGLRSDIDDGYAGQRAAALSRIGVKSIAQLDRAARALEAYVPPFVEHWVARGDLEGYRRPDSVNRGIGLFYLEYILVAAGSDVVQRRWLGDGRQSPRLIQVIETWAHVIQAAGGLSDDAQSVVEELGA
jgi:putative GTP pyrophosphokinase